MGIDRGKGVKIKNQKKSSEHRAMKASQKEIRQGRRVQEESADDIGLSCPPLRDQGVLKKTHFCLLYFLQSVST